MRKLGWRFYAVYILSLIGLYFIGAGVGVLLGANAYVTGLIVMAGGVLRVTYCLARGKPIP